MKTRAMGMEATLDRWTSPRGLGDSSRDPREAERELSDVNRQLAQAVSRNQELVTALHDACEQITSLREEVDKLCAPPSTYGVYLSENEDATVNVLSQGRKVKVNLHLSVK